MAVTVLGNIKESKKGKAAQHLYNSLKYILNPEKTENLLWTGSNCGTTVREIYDAMIQTKNDFQKKSGRQGYHFVISFRPGECSETTAYSVAKDFCETYLNSYDYAFSVHNDRQHMHCHIVFNSVNHTDGSKYRYVKGDWEKYIQPVTDGIARKYNLSELTYDKSEKKGKAYAELAAEKSGRITWKDIIQWDIDRAVAVADDFDAYVHEMERSGYKLRIGESSTHGRYIAYSHKAMADGGRIKARRDYRLADGYKYDDVLERILQPQKKFTPAVIPENETFKIINQYHGNSRFIVCSIERVSQAELFQQYDFTLKEQIRVRKDLLKLNRLKEDCSYLLNNGIKSKNEVLARLEEVKKEISLQKTEIRKYAAVTESLTPEEIKISSDYEKLCDRLENDGDVLNDDEYEELADLMSEYEERYGYSMCAVLSDDDTQKKLDKLKYEKQILTRILKNADETSGVRILSVSGKNLIREDIGIKHNP